MCMVPYRVIQFWLVWEDLLQVTQNAYMQFLHNNHSLILYCNDFYLFSICVWPVHANHSWVGVILNQTWMYPRIQGCTWNFLIQGLQMIPTLDKYVHYWRVKICISASWQNHPYSRQLKNNAVYQRYCRLMFYVKISCSASKNDLQWQNFTWNIKIYARHLNLMFDK